MKPTKLSITFFVILLVSFFSLLAYAFKSDSPTDRLDDISSELAKIARQQEDLSWQIQALEMQYRDLQTEADGLNDEATSIFLSLIPIEKFEETEAEKKTEEQTDEWYPGKLTEDGSNQEMPELIASGSHERFKELMSDYWLDPKVIWEVEEHYGITEWVIWCITIAETSWGKNWAWVKNIWNVWNTDSNPRGQSYSNLWASLDAIGRTLVNKNLWKKQTLGCLSNWHHCEEAGDNGMRYATSSPETSGAWEPNMVVCLSDIYGYEIDPASFNIRNR